MTIILRFQNGNPNLKKNPKKFTINNFKPPINFENKSTLYLTDDYRVTLNLFLKPNTSDIDKDDHVELGKVLDDSWKKSLFIKQYLQIVPAHWDGWYIETHPKVHIIYLNKELNWARIDFRYGHAGGMIIMKKKNNIWRITESTPTWIE